MDRTYVIDIRGIPHLCGALWLILALIFFVATEQMPEKRELEEEEQDEQMVEQEEEDFDKVCYNINPYLAGSYRS